MTSGEKTALGDRQKTKVILGLSSQRIAPYEKCGFCSLAIGHMSLATAFLVTRHLLLVAAMMDKEHQSEVLASRSWLNKT
ncbi:MAG: hypothetical protein ACRD1N_06815 [Terriglobia bacterium]